MNAFKEKASTLASFIKHGSTKKKVAVAIILAVVFVFITTRSNSSEPLSIDHDTREVSLTSVGASSKESSPLFVTGNVRSASEAQLRTESQGEVVGVYVSAGDFVTAGTVLAELRNTAERAAVEQARAGVAAAQATLDKARGGARDEQRAILEANLASAENALTNANANARRTISATRAEIKNAVNSIADGMFANVESANPQFLVASSESQAANTAVKERVALEQVLKRHAGSYVSIDEELSTLQAELEQTEAFLDTLLVVLNNAIPSSGYSASEIAAIKPQVSGARQSVSGSNASVSGAVLAIQNATAGVVVARENLEQGTTGAQDEDIRALEASLAQAQAGLSAARAALARTLVTTPISGTVSSLTIRTGEFVSPFAPAAIVSGTGALEIEAYITSSDKATVAVGTAASIDGQFEGVVTSVSPGLDPVTKKIEVTIGVVDTNVALTNGESVRVAIIRNGNVLETTQAEDIKIPISAVKIETNRSIVFTVDSDDTLTAHEVELGLVLGDTVIIEDGLTPEMFIVTDARGLREGQRVEIK